MKFLSNEEFHKLAKSSRLQFEPSMQQQCSDKLNAVLDYAGALMQVVSLSNVNDPQAIRIHQPLILRNDSVQLSDADALLSRAPEREDRLFVVPVVVTQ